MYIRTISATASDGRWGWDASGEVLDFEDVDRYSARRMRDRFDRNLLPRYLRALGIPAERDDAYGSATPLQRQVTWDSREMTLDETRADYA